MRQYYITFFEPNQGFATVRMSGISIENVINAFKNLYPSALIVNITLLQHY